MPDVGIQIPPNLSDWWDDLVDAGATDLGGLSANGDHISPEHAFPSPHQVRKRLAPRGYALTERLCAYPQYLEPELDRPGGARPREAASTGASSRVAARAGGPSARSTRSWRRGRSSAGARASR